MARIREPRFKTCRRLNLNVCGHPKAMKRAGSGQGRDAKKLSFYGKQLLEKQRLRAYYEVMEKQFRRYVQDAIHAKEITGNALINRLECRLDNLVYRLGFGSSIRQARQMVTHGHLLVNGKKINIPSYKVCVGDRISLREKSRNNQVFKENFINSILSLPYLSKDEEGFTGVLERLPHREEIPIQIDDHLVVEYYSKVL